MRITNKAIWNYLLKILVQGFLLFSLVIVLSQSIEPVGNDKFGKLLLVLLCWYSITTLLPVIILYWSHKRSIKQLCLKLEYDQTNKNSLEHELVKYCKDRVQKIIHVLSPPSYDNRFDIFLWGHYNYHLIIMDNDEVLKVSCLLELDVENTFNTTVENSKKLFPI